MFYGIALCIMPWGNLFKISLHCFVYLRPSVFLLVSGNIYWNLFCRTDSALKFGLFFLLYLVSLWVTLWSIRDYSYLLFNNFKCTLINFLNFLCLQFHILFCVFSAVAPPVYLRENHWRKFLARLFVYRKLGILKACILCKLASMQMVFCYDVSVTHWHYLYTVHILM